MTYVLLADAKRWVGRSDTDDDAEFTAALNGAERAIDRHCGQRFELDVSATVRLFRVTDSCEADLGAQAAVIGNTVGMVVATDDDDDGTAETVWAAGDYYTLPLSGVGPDGRTGWPVNRLVAVGRSFPVGTRRPALQVTARWGWAATPEPVLLAERMLFAAWYQRRATMTGAGGFEGWFASAIRDDQAVTDLLAPYRTGTAIAGMA